MCKQPSAGVGYSVLSLDHQLHFDHRDQGKWQWWVQGVVTTLGFLDCCLSLRTVAHFHDCTTCQTVNGAATDTFMKNTCLMAMRRYVSLWRRTLCISWDNRRLSSHTTIIKIWALFYASDPWSQQWLVKQNTRERLLQHFLDGQTRKSRNFFTLSSTDTRSAFLKTVPNLKLLQNA